MKRNDVDPHNMRLWALKSSAARHRGLTEVDVLFFHFGFRFRGPGTSYRSHVCCLSPWSLREKTAKYLLTSPLTMGYGMPLKFPIKLQDSSIPRHLCVCLTNQMSAGFYSRLERNPKQGALGSRACPSSVVNCGWWKFFSHESMQANQAQVLFSIARPSGT